MLNSPPPFRPTSRNREDPSLGFTGFAVVANVKALTENMFLPDPVRKLRKPSGEPSNINSFLLKVIGRKFVSLDVVQVEILQKLHNPAWVLLKSLVDVWL